VTNRRKTSETVVSDNRQLHSENEKRIDETLRVNYDVFLVRLENRKFGKTTLPEIGVQHDRRLTFDRTKASRCQYSGENTVTIGVIVFTFLSYRPNVNQRNEET